MVGESFHPSGCWGEDSNHIRLGATVQKLLRLFAVDSRLNIVRKCFVKEDHPRNNSNQESFRAPSCDPRGSFLVFRDEHDLTSMKNGV
jgi:hypothetical protein